MYRDFFSNKWVLGGVAFLIVLSVACVWWYHYDTAPDRREAAESAELVRQWEKSQKADSETEQVVKSPTESETQNAEKPINKSIGAETSKSIGEQTDLVLESTQETVKVVRESPYGFGPYPEVPQGFIDAIGHPFWLLPDEVLRRRRKPPSRNVELMLRVMVKLWKEGRTDVEAAFMDGDKVIVHYKNRAYVRYSSYTNLDGEEIQYLSSWSAGSVPPLPEAEPGPNGMNLPSEKDVPPGVELIDLDKDDPGIDPYKFLELNK